MDNEKPLLAVTDATFEQEVINSDKPVLVDFWAAWCAPCRALGPIVEKLAEEYDGKVKVAKLDVDANNLTAQQFGVRSIPTVMLFENGGLTEQIVGVRSIDEYRASLNKTVN